MPETLPVVSCAITGDCHSSNPAIKNVMSAAAGLILGNDAIVTTSRWFPSMGPGCTFVLHSCHSQPLPSASQPALLPRLIRTGSRATTCRFLPTEAVASAAGRRPVAVLPVSDPELGRYRYHEGTSLDIEQP